jgi:hypothetical protein
MKEKQKSIYITDKNWALSKKAAGKHSPKTTRPKWINYAIEKQAETEKVK